jgi:hypothetical protein
MASSLGLIDPSTLVAMFSAALQSIQTWYQVRDSRRARNAFDNRLAEARTDPQIQQQGQTLATLIPPDILKSMSDRVWQCWTDYKETLDGGTIPEVDRAADGIKKCLCRELRRINDLNGNIPDGELRKWWNAYCNNPAKTPAR